MKLVLSSRNMKNIVSNVDNDENGFLFVFGSHEVRMSKIFADFISPYVSRLHCSDSTIDHMNYPSDDSMIEIFTETVLKSFLSLSKGEPIEIDREQSIKLLQLSVLIENEELFNLIMKQFPENEINCENFIEFFRTKEYISKYVKNNYFKYDSFIGKISSNFFYVDKNKLMELPLDIIHTIISHPNLKLIIEDTLFDFIFELEKKYENNKTNFGKFYELIQFVQLTPEKCREFIDKISYEYMTQNFWQNIKDFLISKLIENKSLISNEKRYIKGHILFNGNDKFEGIVSYLKKDINVTSSSIDCNCKDIYAIDFENENAYFVSNDKDNSWLCYDFKDKRVRITGYTIRTSHYWGKNYYHPREFVIEGSNEIKDDKWKILDSKKINNELNGPKIEKFFDINHQLNENDFFKYIRIRQTGENCHGNNSHYFLLSALEYFGSVI